MTILTNARVVVADTVIYGTVVMNGTLITDIQPGRSHTPRAIDCAADILMPGLVDVHTDNLERQVQPRSNARWPSLSALLAHDAQCAVSGVTTVLDALCLGDLGFGIDGDRVRTFRNGVQDLDALAGTDVLKSEHFLHLRCELPAPEMLTLLDPVADHPRVRMVSIMDHTPGVGQYADLDRYRSMRARDGLSLKVIEQRIVELQTQRIQLRDSHRKRLLRRMADCGVPVASHDDRTESEVEENFRDGIRISEFPVSLEAAKAARVRGMKVIAGAPNIVRGSSHSGNVSAAILIREDAVDGLASDYVPASLVEAAFACVAQTGISLPAGIAMVTSRPAEMCGLNDRGRIAPGLRADLVRVREHEGMPVVRQVWRAGSVSSEVESRVAIYYAPERDDPLWAAGCRWLGRDAETGCLIMQPRLENIEAVTASARLYGFHCTLKPPMRLLTSYSEFRDDIAALAKAVQPFGLPALTVSELSGFLTLRESEPSTALQSLADLCVSWPDNHRKPPSASEIERRKRHELPRDAEQLLRRWGYPDVFSRWYFHMTLTRSLEEHDFTIWRRSAELHFEAALRHPRRVQSISLFIQNEPGSLFSLIERVPLG